MRSEFAFVFRDPFFDLARHASAVCALRQVRHLIEIARAALKIDPGSNSKQCIAVGCCLGAVKQGRTRRLAAECIQEKIR